MRSAMACRGQRTRANRRTLVGSSCSRACADDLTRDRLLIQRTALDCLVAVARHHGLDLSADRLAHDFALGEAEPATETMVVT